MTTATLADYIDAHETVYGFFNELSRWLAADELAVQSLCPDWDVRGVIGHVMGVEQVLDGWEPSTDEAPPFQRMGEFAAEVTDLGPEALASRVAEVSASRFAHLGSLEPSVVDAPSITPTGIKTYGDFLRIRIFDMWVHAHDIALPLGETVPAAGIAAELAIDEVAGAAGFIVGKKIGLPDGHGIVFHIHGGVERDIAVAVGGRAAVVDAIESPDVEVTADNETFVMLAAGRIDPQERIDAGRISWSGDAEWAEHAARNLAYTM